MSATVRTSRSGEGVRIKDLHKSVDAAVKRNSLMEAARFDSANGAIEDFPGENASSCDEQPLPRPGPQESPAAAAIHREFQNSGYPLEHARCHMNDSELVLVGRVGKYYFLQIALRIARQFCMGRLIINNIEVVPTQALSLGDVEAVPATLQD